MLKSLKGFAFQFKSALNRISQRAVVAAEVRELNFWKMVREEFTRLGGDFGSQSFAEWSPIWNDAVKRIEQDFRRTLDDAGRALGHAYGCRSA